MTDRVKSFLKPISEAAPCGPDLSSGDLKFAAMEETLKGKPEVEAGSYIRPAEPPPWPSLTEQSETLLGRTKDLRVAMVVCCCWLKKDGIFGFRDGLQLLQGLLENYWDGVYPRVDKEELPPKEGAPTEPPPPVEYEYDFTRRLNSLAPLRSKRGMVTGWVRLADYIYASPVAKPKEGGVVIIEKLLAEPGQATGTSDVSAIVTALYAGASEATTAALNAAKEALSALEAIEAIMTSRVTSGNADSYGELTKILREIVKVLQPPESAAATLPVTGETKIEPGAEKKIGNLAAHAREVSVSVTISGSIRSRHDVVRALEGICEYYRQVEPGSPVPFLLRRVQKIAEMNFVDAVQELNLATMEQLKPSMGIGLVQEGAKPAS